MQISHHGPVSCRKLERISKLDPSRTSGPPIILRLGATSAFDLITPHSDALHVIQRLNRWGWKPHSLNPGDKVKVSLNPLRDGTHGGRLMSIVLPSGATLSGQGGPH